MPPEHRLPTFADPSEGMAERRWLLNQGAFQDGGGGGAPVGLGWFKTVAVAVWKFLTGSKAALWRAIKVVGNHLIDLANGLKDVLLRVGVYLSRFVHLLTELYTKVLRPLIARFFDLVWTVAQTLKKVFKPVIDFLWRVRHELLDVYKHYIRPVLDALEAIRAFLHLLELLHISWAKKLDDWIADVEGFINSKFNYLLGLVNQALSWIDRIVTLDGLLQRVMHLRSLVRDKHELVNLWWNTSYRTLTPEEVKRGTSTVETKEFPERARELLMVLRTRDGPGVTRVREGVRDVLIDVRRARGR